MKLAVSNIAWPAEQDAIVAEALAASGVRGIEVAPTKLWSNPTDATDAEVDACRRTWEARGLEIVAAQALLFGQPALTLFESSEIRRQTLDYLRRIIHVCARLGAKALVFGSPKNRRAGERDQTEVFAEAIEFFGRLGEAAVAEGTTIAMEANPPEYGADFVTRAGQAVDLVKAVNQPGFQLHLDTACMTLAEDSLEATFEAGFPFLRHFHVSEPNLSPIGTAGVDHPAFARELHKRNYLQWISIEMRELQPFSVSGLTTAIEKVREIYSSK